MGGISKPGQSLPPPPTSPAAAVAVAVFGSCLELPVSTATITGPRSAPDILHHSSWGQNASSHLLLLPILQVNAFSVQTVLFGEEFKSSCVFFVISYFSANLGGPPSLQENLFNVGVPQAAGFVIYNQLY